MNASPRAWVARLVRRVTAVADRRTIATTVSISLVSATLVVAAVTADGSNATNVRLDDGTVWVTNEKAGRVGRLNIRIDELDLALKARGADVLQEGRAVFADADNGSVQKIDVVTREQSPVEALPLENFQVRGGVGVAYDPETGGIWTGSSQVLVGADYPESPAGVLPAGSTVHVTAGTDGQTGKVLVVDEDGWYELELDETQHVVTLAGEATHDESGPDEAGDEGSPSSTAATSATSPEEEVPPLPEPDRRDHGVEFDEIENVTSVGDDLVFLLSGGRVAVVGHDPVEVPGDSRVLQQPGLSASDVLVASSEGLFAVPMSGGAPERLVAADGPPAAPVRVGPCVYGAWASDEPMFARQCSGGDEAELEPVPRAVPGQDLVWRVNGRNVALNQPGDGGVWADHEGELTYVGNWSDVEDNLDDSDEEDENTGLGQRTAERNCTDGGGEVPIATDDSDVGVRPRSSVIDVLYNDDDANCEPIVIRSVAPQQGPWGTLTIIDDGQHLLLSPSDEWISAASDSPKVFSFSYKVADAGGNESEKAAVDVVMKDRSLGDSPPELRPKGTGAREMRMVLEEGRAMSYNVMADWWDPDGDDLRLVNAVPEAAGQVTASVDGAVRYAAYGVSPGIQRVQVTVSDGVNGATEPLEVTVKPTGSPIPPFVEDEFITLVAGSTGTVFPLANDADPNESPLDLRPRWIDDADSGHGKGYRTRQEGDAVEIEAITAGTYRLDYDATDGTDATPGSIFLTVAEPSEANTAPVAVPDAVRLRAGRVINVDVLANDIDADGDLLGVTSVGSDAQIGGEFIRASVVDRRLVQIELALGPNGEEPVGPFVVDYTVSDGNGADRAANADKQRAQAEALAARGTITVIVQPPTEDQPPVPQADEAVVRTGDVVSVPVLRDDSDPDADELTLVSVDEQTAADFEADGTGIVWTEGRNLWFQGGAPGRSSILYTIEAGGKPATGEVVFDVVGPFDLEENPNRRPEPPDLELRALRGGEVRLHIPLTGVDRDGDSVILLDEIQDHAGAAAGNNVRVDPEKPDVLVFEASSRSPARDRFTYAVQDRFGGVGTAAVDVLVLDDEGAPPSAHDDLLRGRPGRTLSISVLANDSSPQDRRLELAAKPFFDLEGQPSNLPLDDGVTLLDQEDPDQRGRIDVAVPDVGSTVTEHYRITDGVNPGDAYLRVTPDPTVPNKPPVASRDDVAPSEVRDKTELPVSVLDNDYDPDDATGVLSLSVPRNQRATVRGDQVVVTLEERGRVVLYRLADADGGVSVGQIWVPGQENHPPQLSEDGKNRDLRKIEAGSTDPLRIELDDIVADPDGDADILLTDREVRVLAQQGSVARHEDLTGFTYEPPPELAETTVIPIQFEVTDRPDRSLEEQLLPDCGCRATLTVELVIEASSPPRIVAQGTVPVPQLDEPVEYDLEGLVVDDQDDPLTFELDKSTFGPLDLALSGSAVTIESTRGGDERIPVGRRFTIGFTVADEDFEPVRGTFVVTIIRTNKGQPATASFGVQDAVRDEAFDVPNLLESAFNPFADEDRPLKLIGSRIDGGASVDCTEGGDCTFFSDTVGSFTLSYTIEDAIGQTATGAVPIVVKGAPRKPGVPNIASVGDHRCTLTWGAADDQGAPIDHYVVRVAGGTESQEFTTTGGVFEGLKNDEEYRFTATAVNEIGEGEVSGGSTVCVPDRVPSPPEDLAFTDYGDGTLSLKWHEPSDASDYTAIKDYEVRIGGVTYNTEGATELAVTTGLQNGTDYDFTVRAQNSAATQGGWGEWSAPSAKERPSRYPDEPTNVQAVNAGDGGQPRLSVSWGPPAFDGGRPLDHYRVCRVENPANCQDIPAASTEATFALDRNDSASFTVVAFNTDKNRNDSDPSAPSSLTTPVGNPSPPILNGVTADDHQLTASAIATGESGCSTENLEYRRDSGAWQASPTFTGLTNGTDYTITARAVLPSSCGTPGQTYQSGTSNAIPAFPHGPLQQPSISTGLSGTTINWNWSSNRQSADGLDRLSWSATMSGECAGGAAHPSGSYSRDYGYSSGARTCTITVSATGLGSKVGSASNSTPPPPQPAIDTRQGSFANKGCTRGCNYVIISGRNFDPNAALEYNCEGAAGWFTHGGTLSTNGSGSFGEFTSTCYHDDVNTQVITVREVNNHSKSASEVSNW